MATTSYGTIDDASKNVGSRSGSKTVDAGAPVTLEPPADGGSRSGSKKSVQQDAEEQSGSKSAMNSMTGLMGGATGLMGGAAGLTGGLAGGLVGGGADSLKQSIEWMDTIRVRMCTSARELLVTKSTACVMGITLKNALIITLTAVVFRQPISLNETEGGENDELTQAEAIQVMEMAYLTFFLLVASCSVMTWLVGFATSMPPSMIATYKSGVSLIPAWAWQDVIKALISTLIVTNVVHDNKPAELIGVSVVCALSAAIIQISLEVLTKNFEKDSLVASVVANLMTCFALGTGYAMNFTVKNIVGLDRFEDVHFAGAYAIVSTLACPQTQHLIHSLLTAERRADWPVAAVKTLDFLALSFNFVMAFAYRGLFDAFFEDYAAQGLNEALISALSVSGLCMLGVIVVTLVGVPSDVCSSLALVAGMNIGWTWINFAKACIDNGQEDQTITLASVWEMTGITLIAVIAVAAAAELTISLIEKIEFGKLHEHAGSVGSLGFSGVTGGLGAVSGGLGSVGGGLTGGLTSVSSGWNPLGGTDDAKEPEGDAKGDAKEAEGEAKEPEGAAKEPEGAAKEPECEDKEPEV